MDQPQLACSVHDRRFDRRQRGDFRRRRRLARDPLTEWSTGFNIFRSILFVVWIVRDTQFLQWMSLQRGKRPLFKGILYPRSSTPVPGPCSLDSVRSAMLTVHHSRHFCCHADLLSGPHHVGLAARYLGRRVRCPVAAGSSVYFPATENDRRVGASVQNGIHTRASRGRFVNFRSIKDYSDLPSGK